LFIERKVIENNGDIPDTCSKKDYVKTKIGWCYGNLAYSVTLMKIGLSKNDKEMIKKSIYAKM